MVDLRLVTDKPQPKPSKAPPPGLTNDQRARLSAALQNLHGRFGTWQALADAMGLCISTLVKACRGRCGSMAMVVRAAELLHVPVEQLLTGTLADAGKCPYCGQRREASR
jgi:hypothetical protein